MNVTSCDRIARTVHEISLPGDIPPDINPQEKIIPEVTPAECIATVLQRKFEN